MLSDTACEKYRRCGERLRGTEGFPAEVEATQRKLVLALGAARSRLPRVPKARVDFSAREARLGAVRRARESLAGWAQQEILRMQAQSAPLPSHLPAQAYDGMNLWCITPK